MYMDKKQLNIKGISHETPSTKLGRNSARRLNQLVKSVLIYMRQIDYNISR